MNIEQETKRIPEIAYDLQRKDKRRPQLDILWLHHYLLHFGTVLHLHKPGRLGGQILWLYQIKYAYLCDTKTHIIKY